MTTTAQLYEQHSGKGPPLVVLHGLFGDSDNFRSAALHLERHMRVIRLDLPGHGHSPWQSDLSFSAMAATVQTHLSKNNVTQYHLLGHSLGGKVAMTMAGNASGHHIGALVVVDIAPRLYPPHHLNILTALNALPLHEIKRRSDADEQLRVAIPDAGTRHFLLKSLYRTQNKHFAWRFDLQTLISEYEQLRHIPPISEKIQTPTLFIKGGNSNYLTHQDEGPIKQYFEKPSFKEIGGTGHTPHAEKPAVFTKLVLDFLRLHNDQIQ